MNLFEKLLILILIFFYELNSNFIFDRKIKENYNFSEIENFYSLKLSQP